MLLFVPLNSLKKCHDYHVVIDRSNNIYIKVKNQLTFAIVFVVISDFLPVVDQWSFGVQVRARSIWQRLVVQMEQLAVVRRAYRWSFEYERSTEELIFDFTSQPTR